MPLEAGAKLGPYEILGLLGKGGMGEVYRARDLRLNRDVAIKVSAQGFSQRFEHEAKVIASLNHPNICQLYDIGPDYLVMELVEGVAPHGPMALDEALRIAQQIAAALEAAHEKGVTHRDLKPANIKVKSDGTVKVLDFGLAKSTTDSGSEDTVSLSLTESGVVVGTAAYMSPEQAQGKLVDKRSDIWAFGVVLHELLTGQRLFKGDSIADTLAQVMTKTPDWTGIPSHVQPLLHRCLERDPQRRLRDIGDSMALLETASAVAPTGETSRPRPPWLLWSGFAAATLAALVLAFLYFGQRSAPAEPILTQITLPEGVDTSGRNLTVSPDGRKVAFSAAGPDGISRVWVRFMDSLEVQELPGSDTTQTPPPFFWSPDSRFIAYSAPESRLKKIDLTGSPPQTLCKAPALNTPGGTWNRDGVIVFGATTGFPLMQVSEKGGTPSPVTALNSSRGETRHAFPTFLRDGRRFLYLRSSSVPENNGVYLGSLDTKPEEQDSRQLLATPFAPVYVPSREPGRGHLLIMREGGTVWAQAFDEGHLQLVGDPVLVLQHIGALIASGFFSASGNGILAYRSIGASQEGRLYWYGRQGLLANAEQARFSALALSSNGEKAALVRQNPANPRNRDIWTWDTTQGSSAQLTFDPGRAEAPVWSPDGGSIIFRSNRDGVWNLYRKLANGSKEDEVLLKTLQDKTPTSLSRDGQYLLYTQSDSQKKTDVLVLSNPVGSVGERRSKPFLSGNFNESEAQFSPEGEAAPRWVAYTSDESGRSEVWVREFSQNATSGKWQVSKQGGSSPHWRGDGKELFFASPDGAIMAVDISSDATFHATAPTELFKVPSGILASWDVVPDGKRFLVLSRIQENTEAPFTVWQNWPETLKK